MATYSQIQNWVKINYGFTVKTCWIAHVKEKCGLEPRRAPNRSFNSKRKYLCPQDKIDPIKKAFKHFRMIQKEKRIKNKKSQKITLYL